MIHQRFNVGAIEDIPAEKLPEAVAYVHALTLHNRLCHRWTYGARGLKPHGGKLCYEVPHTRVSRTDAVLADGYLLINQTGNKAETLLSHLREALGGLPAHPTFTRHSVSELMNQWLLRGEADGQFELGDYVALVGAGDMAPEVRIKREDVTAGEVVRHVKNGKRVVELGLVWRESVVLVLTQDLTLKRISYLDHLQEDAESHGDDAAGNAFASQIIMAHALTGILDELAELLGNWQE